MISLATLAAGAWSVAKWLLGISAGAADSLARAEQARLEAKTEEQKRIAEVSIEAIRADVAARHEAGLIRRETAGFPEMRVITAVIAGCFTLHLVLVTADTCFKLGWRIPAYPDPFDDWQGVILLSFFGLQAAQVGLNTIASAIRGRK